MPTSQEAFGALLADDRFWQADPEKRLSVIDQLSNDYADPALPEADLVNWSQNRFKARAVARIGIEEFNKGLDTLATTGEIPEQFMDRDFQEDFSKASAIPYEQSIKLSAGGEKADPTIAGMASGVTGSDITIPSGDGEGGVNLKFIPHPTQYLADITTPKGVRRHNFESFDNVPKSGQEMSRFLIENYGEDFDVSEGLIGRAFSHLGSSLKGAYKQAGETLIQMPYGIDQAMLDISMGDKGIDTIKNNTVDAEGNFVPMPKELSDQLWKRAEDLRKLSTVPTEAPADGEFGFGPMSALPKLTMDEAFAIAHNEHLKSLPSIPVTGNLKFKANQAASEEVQRNTSSYLNDASQGLPGLSFDINDKDNWRYRNAKDRGWIDADPQFKVFQDAQASANPDAPSRPNLVEQRALEIVKENEIPGLGSLAGSIPIEDARKQAEQEIPFTVGSQSIFKVGDKVTPAEILAAHASANDLPRRKALWDNISGRLENVRALDAWYGKNTKETLTRERDGIYQQALNFHEEALKMLGQQAPALAANALIPGSGVAAMTIGNVTGVQAESTNEILFDNLAAGKSLGESVENAARGGNISAAIAAPIDMIGDIALYGPLMRGFSDSLSRMAPTSRAMLAKDIARMMDSDVGLSTTAGRRVGELAAEGLSETSGELVRSSVSAEFQENPDPFSERLGDAVYEGALSLITAGHAQLGADVVSTIANAVENRQIKKTGIDPGDYRNLMRLPAAERSQALGRLFGEADAERANGIPPQQINGAAVAPASQTIPVAQAREEAPVQPAGSTWTPEEAEASLAQQEQTQAFKDAAPTTDESEIAQLDSLGLKPGDMIQSEGNVVKVLRGPLSEDGNTVSVIGINPQGEQVTIPEADIQQPRVVAMAEEVQGRDAADAVQASEDIVLPAPPKTRTEPVQAPAPAATIPAADPLRLSPTVTFRRPGEPAFQAQLSPENIDFTKSSGVSPDNFSQDDQGNFLFSRNGEPMPRSIDIQLASPKVEGESTGATDNPTFNLVRDYSTSERSVRQWVASEGFAVGGSAPLGEFLSAYGVNPESFIGPEAWAGLSEYTTQIPVVLADGDSKGRYAMNVRTSSKEGTVSDGVVISRDRWAPASTEKKAEIILHEVLHSAFSDWKALSNSDVASPENKALLKDMEEFSGKLRGLDQIKGMLNSPYYANIDDVSLLEEVMVRALTSPDTRAILQSFDENFNPLKPDQEAYTKTLWEKLVGFFREVFSQSPNTEALNTLFDRIVGLHKQSEQQRLSFVTSSKFGSSEAVHKRAADIGLVRGDYSVATLAGTRGFRLVLQSGGKARITEAQAAVDAATLEIRQPMTAEVLDATADQLREASAPIKRVRTIDKKIQELDAGLFAKLSKSIQNQKRDGSMPLAEFYSIFQSDDPVINGLLNDRYKADLEAAGLPKPSREDAARSLIKTRTEAFRRAKNRLAEAMALDTDQGVTTALNVVLDDQRLDMVANTVFSTMENNLEDSLVNPLSPESTLLGEVLNDNVQSKQFLQRVINEGAQAWSDGFRSFPAWKAKMSSRYPNAPIEKIWGRMQETLGEALAEVGVSGTTSFRYGSKTENSIARNLEYKNFLRSVTAADPAAIHPFLMELVDLSKTKISKPSRDALYRYGPFAGRRDAFLALGRDPEKRYPFIQFNEELFNEERLRAAQNSEWYANRLRDLDQLPEAVRQAKERLEATGLAKYKIKLMLKDVTSRYGVTPAGSTAIYDAMVYNPLNSPEVSAAVWGALQEGRAMLGLTEAQLEKSHKGLNGYLKQFKSAWSSVHNRSPERIFNEPKTKEISDEETAKARSLGSQHGYSVATHFLDQGLSTVALDNLANTPEVKAVFERLVLSLPQDIRSRPNFPSEQLHGLLDDRLDQAYLNSFVRGIRQSVIKTAVSRDSRRYQAISAIDGLLLGEKTPSYNESEGRGLLVGGVNFANRDLYDGLVGPIFNAVVKAGQMGNAIDGIASVAGQNYSLTADDTAARKAKLKSSYDYVLSGYDDQLENTSDAEGAKALKERLLNEVTFRDEEFTKSFDAFRLGMANPARSTEDFKDEANSDVDEDVVRADYEVAGAAEIDRSTSLLKDLRSFFGPLRENSDIDFTSYLQNEADQVDADGETTRAERRNNFERRNAGQEAGENKNLRTVQTNILLHLTGNNPSAAMALARQIISESVIKTEKGSGFVSSDRVTQMLEDMLVERAANSMGSSFLRQKSLDQVFSRIAEAVPIGENKVRLALGDSVAEMTNMADLVEMFATSDSSPVGSILADFLRGNIRDIPVLLLDTSKMDKESARAFQVSSLLNETPSTYQKSDPESQGEYKGEFFVFNLGWIRDAMKGAGNVQAKDTNPHQQFVSRVLSEGLREALSGDTSTYLERQSRSAFASLRTALDSLNQGLDKLEEEDSSAGLRDDPKRSHLLREVRDVSERLGGFENASVEQLAIEVLSNQDFREALALFPRNLFNAPRYTKSGADRVTAQMGIKIAAHDYNQAQYKMSAEYADGAGEIWSDDDGAEVELRNPEDDFSLSPDLEGGFSMAPAFAGITMDPVVDEGIRRLSFNEDLISNSLELIRVSNKIKSRLSPTQDWTTHNDFIPSTETVEYGLTEATTAALTTTRAESLNQAGLSLVEANSGSMQALSRSLKARIGRNVEEWTSEWVAEDQPTGDVAELPGATTDDVALAYQVKAMAGPATNNPLFSGVTTKEADPRQRRDLARVFAEDYYSTMIASPELAPIFRDVAQNDYSRKWFRANVLFALEDLAEYSMRPAVSKAAASGIHAAVAGGFARKPGVGTIKRVADIKLHMLYDKWRDVTAKEWGSRFLTNAVWNPVSHTKGGRINSLQQYNTFDDVVAIYGAKSPELRSNIDEIMGYMMHGIDGASGVTGFKSKSIDIEERFNGMTEKLLGSYQDARVRAQLAGLLTQYPLDGNPNEAIAKSIEELEKAYQSLVSVGKDQALRSWKMRKIYRQEMDRFFAPARQFAGGAISLAEYENQINALMSPNERQWVANVRQMFDEIRPAHEATADLLGRTSGSYKNYIPWMNAKLDDSTQFIDNMFRPVGEKVGSSKSRSLNERFIDVDHNYMMDLDGGQVIRMLKRDLFMMETAPAFLLLHHTLGTKLDGGAHWVGAIMDKAKTILPAGELAALDVTLSGMRMLFDRTRTGLQSGLAIDNSTRRILLGMSQAGAFMTLADVDQVVKQTIPAIALYTGRIALNEARRAGPKSFRSDKAGSHARAAVASISAFDNPQLRENMIELTKTMAPAIMKRGADGNKDFQEKLALELRKPIQGALDIAGMANHASAGAKFAVGTAMRTALDWTTGKPDGAVTWWIFHTEYLRRAFSAGLTQDQAFDKSNWNQKWATESRIAAEEIMGTSALEERGQMLQMKGSTVGSEFWSTAFRAFGSHSTSMASHSRRYANEMLHSKTAAEKLTAAYKLAEIGIQNVIFNLLAKPTRDLALSHLLALVPGLDMEQEDIYEKLLNEIPWERRTKPVGSGYEYWQQRGWKTMFDLAPMTGRFGTILSLPVVNDFIRTIATEGLRYGLADVMEEDYKPFQKSEGEALGQATLNALGYPGAVVERGISSMNMAVDFEGGIREWRMREAKDVATAFASLFATRGIQGRLEQNYRDTDGASSTSGSGMVFE